MLGGGVLIGWLAAKAVRLIIRMPAIITGLIILVLMYLSYKDIIDVNYIRLEHVMQSRHYDDNPAYIRYNID